MKRSTEELLEILKKSSDIATFMDENSEDMIDKIPLCHYLDDILIQKKLKKSEVIRRSGLDRKYCYEIFAGTKSPSRDKVLALCFAANLSDTETMQLLKSTGYPQLYARIERDSVILFALQHQLSLTDANDLLFEMDFPCLE